MHAVEQQDKAEEALRRSLSLSLRSTGNDWYAPTLTRAKAIASAMYREIFGGRIPDDIRAAIVEHVESALKATQRNPDQRDTQSRRIAHVLASYIATAVLDSNTPDSEWEKVWRTRGDSKVRDSHRAAEGQVVNGEDDFTVGGHKMFGPHDLTAPPEEWMECRCYAEYRRRTAMPQPDQMVATGALVAAVSTLNAEGFLEVSRELFDEAVRNGTAVQVGIRDDGVVLYDLVAAVNPDGFVIVGLPAADDPIQQVSSEVPPHVTMLYLSVDFIEQAEQIIAGEAPKYQPVDVTTTGISELGDQGATVANLEPAGLTDIRDALLTYEPIQQGVDAVEQYPEWTPHLTLGYPQTPPLSTDVPATISIDRLAILDGEGAVHSEFTLGEPMSDQPQEPTAPAADEFPSDGAYEEVPIYGVIAPEGAPTGDKRGMLPDSLSWTEPPLTLRTMFADAEGHMGSVPTGRMDKIWRDGNLIKFEGVASMSEDGDRMVGLIGERVLRGLSMDLDDAIVEMRNADGSEVTLPEPDPTTGEIVVDDAVFNDLVNWVVKGRIRSAAALPIPAFPESFVAIGTWAEHDAQPQQDGTDVPAEPVTVDPELVASAAADLEPLVAGITSNPSTEDGPGWLTHPVDTDRLRDYWVRGAGAAKIGWGAPGDFNRCRALLAQYIKPLYLAGYCANRHKDALGFWPGEHRGGKHSAQAEPFSLVASVGGTLRPPREWFDNPNFAEVAGITITEPDPHTGLRRFYGHAAEWDVCHTGFADRCVSAPHSPSDYRQYHLGYVVLDDGTNLPTGAITMGTGHADLGMRAASVAAHYDNTGTQVAQVRAGEDAFGIWVAGVCMPDITPEDVFRLRGAKLSGDWRNVAGQGLDTIAVLAVNVPGFPVVRAALAASAGERQALVAAGVIGCHPVPDEDEFKAIVAAAVSEKMSILQARQTLRSGMIARRRAAMASIAASAAQRKGD